MATTKNGERAVKVRGYERVYLVYARPWRMHLIEVKPGVAIEDVDLMEVVRSGDWTYEEIASASCWRSKYDVRKRWYVTKGNNCISQDTKAQAEVQMRMMLADMQTLTW